MTQNHTEDNNIAMTVWCQAATRLMGGIAS